MSALDKFISDMFAAGSTRNVPANDGCLKDAVVLPCGKATTGTSDSCDGIPSSFNSTDTRDREKRTGKLAIVRSVVAGSDFLYPFLLPRDADEVAADRIRSRFCEIVRTAKRAVEASSSPPQSPEDFRWKVFRRLSAGLHDDPPCVRGGLRMRLLPEHLKVLEKQKTSVISGELRSWIVRAAILEGAIILPFERTRKTIS